MSHARRVVLGVTLAVVLAGIPLLAGGVKVKVLEDKRFDFTGLRTYAWRLDDVQPVKVLQNTMDDPVQIRRTFEPMILQAVDKELANKGFSRVSSGQPDLYLDYYLLVGPGVSSQFQGQFIGAVPEWGLPDFMMSTTSLKVYEQGAFIVDVVSPKEARVVWRGSADAKVDRTRKPAERESIIAEAAAKMLKKFPPKFKKST